MIKGLIEKILCKHQWDVVHIVRYCDAPDKILMVCRRCGRITRKRL